MNIEFRLDAKGIGDAVCGVYTACGLADRGHIVTFHAKHEEWLRWIEHTNLTIVRDMEARVLNANANYNDQLEASRLGTCESRSLWYMKNIHAEFPKIKGDPLPARPLKILPCGTATELPKDYIVLAPFSAYADRQWSIQHWRMLARVLMNEGHNVIAIGGHKHGDALKAAFTKTGVTYWWGQSPEWVVKAIRNAKILIGNDSGPAHIAGLYGSKAIALCGQIDGQFVYKHSPTVTPVHPPESVPCRMCHWKAAGHFTDLCANECSALQLISPFEVADLALKEIQGTKPDGDISTNHGQRKGGRTGRRQDPVQRLAVA